MREWVTPLDEALAVPLGISELTDPRRYLHVPRDFSDDDAQIRIDVPTHMRFNEDLVADLIVKKLALETTPRTPAHRWKMLRSSPPSWSGTASSTPWDPSAPPTLTGSPTTDA